MKALLFALLLLFTPACAGTTPQDTLVEFRTWLVRAGMAYDALDRAYMTLCFQRENAPECIEIDEHRQSLLRGVNSITTGFNKYNAKIGGK